MVSARSAQQRGLQSPREQRRNTTPQKSPRLPEAAKAQRARTHAQQRKLPALYNGDAPIASLPSSPRPTSAHPRTS
eukprot:1307030-Amphidinium_carterae.1